MRQATKARRAAADRVPTSTDTLNADENQPDVVESFLHFVMETDDLLGGGARFFLHGVDDVFIGRVDGRTFSRERRGGKNCLDVSVANVRTSERHAQLARQPSGDWLLQDLGSRNGTLVNGNRMVEAVILRPGDLVQVGRALFTFARAKVPADANMNVDVDSTNIEARSLPGFATYVPWLAERLRRLRSAISSKDPLVIVGSTGTGKEVLANAIHAASRAKEPFVGVNCGGLAPNLIEGQLFGYLKGAYSGADRGDPGFIRAAHHGTLFLDEILELPLAAQAKLLRVLQEGEVVSLGSARAVAVDVRFVAATQRDLHEVVASGKFRADLQARLERHIIEIPPLNQRREDVGLLVAAILRKAGVRPGDELVLPSTAVPRIFGYSWPLNIREFENALVRSLRLARGPVLDTNSFPPPDARPAGQDGNENMSDQDRESRNRLIALLRKHGGNLTAAAGEMRMHRQQVYRLAERFGLDPASFRAGRTAAIPTVTVRDTDTGS